MRIVLVEDNLQLATTISDGLSEDGYTVEVLATAATAIERGLRRDLDVMVLDLGLPDRDGIEVLRELRAARINVPILVLTARDAVEARVAALDAGADDYLVKPFAFAELLARLRALMRRGRVTETPRLAVGELHVDLITRKVTRAGQSVELTVREFELLEYLARHHGQVVSRETLARDVWKETSRTTPLDNVIDVHIARLRRKIDHEHPVKLIHTVRGVGFMLREGEP